MRYRLILIAVLCPTLLVFNARKARGQEDKIPARDTWGLRFGLPDGGGGGVGAVYFVSDRTSLGADLHFDYGSAESDVTSERSARQTSRTTWGVRIRPEVRRYLGSLRGVVPFLTGSVGAGYDSRSQDDGRTASSWAASARAGVGAEWLPVEGIGISGSTGISTFYRSSESEREDPASEDRGSSWSVGAFRSALLLSLYS